MDILTAKILVKIAEIQVEALETLKKNQLTEDHALLCSLLSVPEEEISNALDDHITLYKEIRDTPSLINMLNEYQLSICAHILYRLEDEWIIDNSQGVYGAWQILFGANKKFHPEFTLILK